MTHDQNPNDLQILFEATEAKAGSVGDGHLTIMRFTTGWKCMIGTPNLDDGSGRATVADLPNHVSLVEALKSVLS